MKSFLTISVVFFAFAAFCQIPRSGSQNQNPNYIRPKTSSQPQNQKTSPIIQYKQESPRRKYYPLWDEQGHPRSYNFPVARTNAPSFYNEFSIEQKEEFDQLYVQSIWTADIADQAERSAKANRENTINKKKKEPLHAWRKIDGAVVYVKATNSGFYSISGKAIQVTSHGILAEAGQYYPAMQQPCFIEDFPFTIADGEEFGEILVREAGVKSFTTVLSASRTVRKFNYGIPCSRPAGGDKIEVEAQRLTAQEEKDIHDEELLAAAKRAEADVAMKARENFVQGFLDKKQKKIEPANQEKQAKSKTFQWNQEQAQKDNAYGLFRMGERFRDGDEVEKDLVQAKEYLVKAVAAGSTNAADALSKLNQLSPNKRASPE